MVLSVRAARSLTALALLAGFTAAPPAPPRPPPRRVVSLNLCADQYLIALADPGQIAGLSQFARDPEMSYFAERARRLPAAARNVEQVLVMRPDLVMGVPYRQRDALAPLASEGVAMLDLPKQEGLADIERTIAMVAAAVGHPERGRAMIAGIRARLAAIRPPPGRGRVAAYYQRRGYLTGAGTLVDEMIRRIGLVNLATRLGRPALSRLAVEQIALAHPDFLILESATARVADEGTELLHHPVLDGLTRIYIPEALTVCGGPAYADAVALLAARVRDVDRRMRAREKAGR